MIGEYDEVHRYVTVAGGSMSSITIDAESVFVMNEKQANL
jgi:hypothetical protein